MNSLVIDYYALGLHPKSFDLLIELIDLELGLADSPDSLYVLRFVLNGWSQREIARELGVEHHHVRKHINKARSLFKNRTTPLL